ncbi:hypothetical protein FRC02_002764 [Tulasnella sp. 418]|nr:hypothetical protein FRC02_002764 [Tulasnella sp. 418]
MVICLLAARVNKQVTLTLHHMSSDSLDLLWHPRLSFSDGNIVLRVRLTFPPDPPGSTLDEGIKSQQKGSADNKQSTHIHFRVHKSVLSDHSEVFSNMLDIPQPQFPDCTLINGCDFVDLHDSSTDIEKLLQVIYGFNPPYKRLYQSSIDYYGPVLELAKKYEMKQVINTYLPHVIDGWPTSLDEWKLFETEIELIGRRLASRTSASGEGDDGDILVQPSSMIRLARHFPEEFSSILPAIYLDLTRLSSQMRSNTSRGHPSAGLSNLLGTEYATLLAGQSAITHYILQFLNEPDKVMELPGPCSVERYITSPKESRIRLQCAPAGWWKWEVARFLTHAMFCHQGDIFSILGAVTVAFDLSFLDQISSRGFICDSCYQRVKAEFICNASKKAWTKLSAFFGLEELNVAGAAS